MSKFGLSQVVVTFEDNTDIHFARQLVDGRLNAVALPANVGRPKLGPVSTGLGEVFHYTVALKGWNYGKATEAERVEKLTYLRTVHDWTIRPRFATVPGVADVNSWGGYEKQFRYGSTPTDYFKHGVTFSQVVEALERNNQNVGGGGIRQNTQFLLVHGAGPHRRPGADPRDRRASSRDGARGSRSRRGRRTDGARNCGAGR